MRRRGLGLLEQIVALSLVSLVLLVVLNIFPQALSALSQGEGRLQAQKVAQAELENALAQGFHSLSPGRQPLGSRTAGGWQFEVEREIQNSGDLQVVTVRVSWHHRGQARSMVQQMRRPRYGI